jgi:transcription antitermination factor NusG
MIVLSIKRTIKKHFFEFNIFVYNALSRNVYLLRFEREYVSFKPRSALGTIVKSSILFLQVIENQKYWFAARTRDKQEFAVRKSLDKLKSEENLDIDYYLPTRIVISQLKYRRKRSEVPAIRNLIFIYATKQTACDLSNVYSVRLYYMKDLFTHSMLVVPNKQMKDFMVIMDLNPDGVSFDSEPFAIGNKVKVIKGDFSGIEGEVVTEANKTYVVIRIKGVLVASVKVPKSYLKIIE